jgi:hypothetical protein
MVFYAKFSSCGMHCLVYFSVLGTGWFPADCCWTMNGFFANFLPVVCIVSFIL